MRFQTAMFPKKSLGILLIFAAVSCSRSGKMQRDQQTYDVVQEGSSSGEVTSTINAPGETNTAVTSSAITGTNVDTTTAFTVPGTATSTAQPQQPGTIAGTFPTTETARPRPARPRTPSVTTNPPMSSGTDTAAPPPTTDTVAPPPTDTTGTQG
jgi:hypothetical protein